MKADLEFDAAWQRQRRSMASQTLDATPARRAAAALRGIAGALIAAWQRPRHDERTEYLSRATSHADLEHRMRAWEDHALGRARMPPTM